jgi:hypothetical protein
VAPALRLPREKQRERPERFAPPVCVTTRFAGSVRQVVTDVAVDLPMLVARMPTRIVSPLTRRVLLGNTVSRMLLAMATVATATAAAALGVTGADAADAGEVPAAFVAVTVKV